MSPETLCQCEHESHMMIHEVLRGAGPDRHEVKMPTAHRYGHAHATRSIRTPYGVFDVCETCASTCMKGIDG